MTGVLIKRGNPYTDRYALNEDDVKWPQEKRAICKPRSKTSEKASAANTLILDF